MSNTRAKVDSILYGLYHSDDLRKVAFFKSNNNGTYGFKGSYEGSASLFDGITTAEILLIRSECYARSGKVELALSDLNHLMLNRWNNRKTFIPVETDSQKKALEIILLERRKELLMRGLRWMDIKRLNKEGAGITLQRKLNGQTYTLHPGDQRFALPIPEDIIALTGMPQNPR
ncbi:RagB/SusD family nutrient uptake outer membrane protein [Sphingobacterium sp. UBA7038]|nr:RagB/SusD family nutrient uptake outer membrane protein [Sphingobacterium sp. UBA7038]